MPYTKVVTPLDISVVLSYIAVVVNSHSEFEYNYSYSLTITNQTEYDASGWFTDVRPKPTWSDIETYWPSAVDYYNVRPNNDVMVDAIEEYLAVELVTELDAKADKTTTVNGHALSSNVTVTKGDMGLGNCDNTSDANKPVSTATQTALDAKFDTPTGTTAQYVRGDGTLATLPTPAARSFTNNASRSLTSSTGAAGFQVSATRDAAVNYNVTSSTTATIGGASSITVVLEIAPTNSATAGDWVEISRFSNGQTITLAIALQSVQTGAGNLGGIIPAGYYAKLRTITSGTASASYNTGQEVLL